MKILITEEQKKKLFIPRKLDERKGTLKKELVNKTKELLTSLNITYIRNHGRIDDYDELVDKDEHIHYGYSSVIIDGKSYFGLPKKFTDEQYELISNWEGIVAAYLNNIFPHSPEEGISKVEPAVVNRSYRIDITPDKIDVSILYKIATYTNGSKQESFTI